MEQHGNNQQQLVTAIIPARFASTRLPGKLLLPLAGKPLILHTLERARAARNVSRVIVATDDARIFDVVSQAGGEAVMTSAGHRSGSDRIAEAAESLPEGSVIVNVQGDEPMIPSATIETAVDAMLRDDSADIVTTSERIEDFRDVISPDVVKVVTDSDGYALYFSRSPIPFPRVVSDGDGDLENALANDPKLIEVFRKHTGLYVYRRAFLLRFAKMEPTVLERTEMLEQLRAIENGARIKVVEARESSIGVDSEEDYERVRALMETENV